MVEIPRSIGSASPTDGQSRPWPPAILEAGGDVQAISARYATILNCLTLYTLTYVAARTHHDTFQNNCINLSPSPTRPSNHSSMATAMEIAVVGAHLSTFPLNADLLTLNATLSKRTTTAPTYKLYELANTTPAKPGLVRDPQGSSIEVEIWKMPLSNVGAFLSTIDSPLGLGSVEMEDGRWVTGFICEAYGLEGARDVTGWGGWRKYRLSCE